MAVVLALSAAVVYGAGDFLGGVATRQSRPQVVTLVSHLASFTIVLVALPFFPPEAWTARDLALGAASGVVGGAGVALLYWGLATGTMSVVAPLTALTAGAVPAVVGVALGNRPALVGFLGIALALVAIVLITRETPAEEAAHTPRTTGGVVTLALGAGLLFGVFFVLLERTSDDSGLWPLIGARLASIALMALLVAGLKGGARLAEGSLAATLGCGMFDMGANILYLLATHHGLLAVVAVLTALYPASTVVLAQAVLGERLQRHQLAGLGGAAVAAGLLAVA